MKKEEISVCILRVGGTNCDAETKRAFDDLGVEAKIVHLNAIIKKGNLLNYSALVIPGGFSYGDYVRAGAIWAKEVSVKIGSELQKFAEVGRPILGICNGFQVLVEAGLLPGFAGISKYPEAALATNVPIGYYCGWVYLQHENSGNCIFTQKIPKGKALRIPVAHAEGRFIFSKENENAHLKQLCENDQLVFRYCDENGAPANGKYPVNPNGASYDIAGICNPSGTIFGLMPHPERAYYGWQLPDWTKRERIPKYGDGRLIFESMVECIKEKQRN
jgi:phosphoribosylformylglycinamidine synthase I